VVARLTEWLERWPAITAVRERAGADYLWREVLMPAERLADQIRRGLADVCWLELLQRAADGRDTIASWLGRT